MQQARRVLMVLSVFSGFVFIQVSQGVAEDIYRWKDPDGVQCFSNVSPPGGVLDFSIMTSSPFEATPATPAEALDDAGSADNVSTAENGSDRGTDPAAALLRDRIRSRKISIEYMETLLRSHSNDDDLRKRLFNKRLQLHEDITRLELLQDERE